MFKVNLGLLGILISLILLIIISFKLNEEFLYISDKIESIEFLLSDIDEDIHRLKEK